MFNVARKVTNPRFLLSRFLLLSERKSNISFDVLINNNDFIGMIGIGGGETLIKVNGVDLKWHNF